ncbi:MAG: hypothetical protein AB1726_03515 [Planctomycetota bacterium]
MTAQGPIHRAPLIGGRKSVGQVTRDICLLLEERPRTRWWIAFALAATALLGGAAAVLYQISVGIGTWGLNNTVGWAFDITNFVFWIGIGHAGTLIPDVALPRGQAASVSPDVALPRGQAASVSA